MKKEFDEILICRLDNELLEFLKLDSNDVKPITINHIDTYQYYVAYGIIRNPNNPIERGVGELIAVHDIIHINNNCRIDFPSDTAGLDSLPVPENIKDKFKNSGFRIYPSLTKDYLIYNYDYHMICDDY